MSQSPLFDSEQVAAMSAPPRSDEKYLVFGWMPDVGGQGNYWKLCNYCGKAIFDRIPDETALEGIRKLNSRCTHFEVHRVKLGGAA